jgi:hypothetical protein
VTNGPLAEMYREAARLLLLKDAGLVAETRTYDVEGFAEKRIITMGGRQKKYLWVSYNRGVLPILPTWHPLSRLYLEEAHRMDHAGVDAMVMRSRSQETKGRVSRGRDTDGEIGKGEIEEGECELTFHCLSLNNLT